MHELQAAEIVEPRRPRSRRVSDFDTEAIILGLGRTRGETLRAVMVDGEERLRYQASSS